MGAQTALLFAAALLPACAPAGAEAPPAGASLEEIYRNGVTFPEFLESATRRKDLWSRNYSNGAVDSRALARARGLTRPWRLLVVAEDWCSDSVNTIPFVALLAEQAEAIELRVVSSQVGKALMESHPTPDGRPATPTLLVLDEGFEEVGCWVERPSPLQAWALEHRESLGEDFLPQKMEWYREDAGRSTVDEVLAVIEAAERGDSICATG